MNLIFYRSEITISIHKVFPHYTSRNTFFIHILFIKNYVLNGMFSYISKYVYFKLYFNEIL